MTTTEPAGWQTSAVCDVGIPDDLTTETCPHAWSDDGIPTPPGQIGTWWHCNVCGADHQDEVD